MELAKEYIKQTMEKETLPNVESFVIWLMENKEKSYDEATIHAGKYKGYINTSAISYLKERASGAKRNSFVYVQLLKNLMDSQDLNTTEKLIVNIDLNTKEGDNGF